MEAQSKSRVKNELLLLLILFLLLGSSSSSRSNNSEEAISKEEEIYVLNSLSYHNLGEPITDWDSQRKLWLSEHPHIKAYNKYGKLNLFIISGSQPTPCMNPQGDYLYLKSLKNKIDYCRLHDIGLFYNMALLNPSMPTFWAKLPVVRSTMLSHPEVEWIWWLDADAIITDMEFEMPLEQYKDVNFVVHGWEGRTYEARSWVGLNAGSFLIRNCQWSLDFMERWADMGPQSPIGEAAAQILSDFLVDRSVMPTDDQSVLVYLLNKEKDKWGQKALIQSEYALSGYWVEVVDGYEKMEEKYKQMEKEHPELAKRDEEREEMLLRELGMMREKYLKNVDVHERRSFVTHFTGCQPCSGHHNKIYAVENCIKGMIRALNYADDQVLRGYGYKHKNLQEEVVPL